MSAHTHAHTHSSCGLHVHNHAARLASIVSRCVCVCVRTLATCNQSASTGAQNFARLQLTSHACDAESKVPSWLVGWLVRWFVGSSDTLIGRTLARTKTPTSTSLSRPDYTTRLQFGLVWGGGWVTLNLRQHRMSTAEPRVCLDCVDARTSAHATGRTAVELGVAV